MRPVTRALSVTAILSAALLCARPTLGALQDEEQKAVQVEFLEIVTAEVDQTCKLLAELHGVTFSEPVAEFGKARTATLRGGGLLSVRAPMHDAEEPVVRPYVLVEDLEAAVEAAKAAGVEMLVPPMAIPERGRFALYLQGDNQYGLWEN